MKPIDRFFKMIAVLVITLPLLIESFYSSPIVQKNICLLNGDSSVDTSKRKNKKDFRPWSHESAQLQMIYDDRQEFDMNVGKAVDTLRDDYPKIFRSCPDFSIYHKDLEVIDPSGVKLHGINNYKNFFRVLRAIVSLFYCSDDSALTFRFVFDQARSSIRFSWHAILVPKRIYGGYRNMLHLDGISVYEVDKSGVIVRHRVEHLLLNDNPVQAPKGIFEALVNEAQQVPGLVIEGGAVTSGDYRIPSIYFFESRTDAFKERNSYRMKYGLPPLTLEEFEEIEARVQAMEEETHQRKLQLQSAAQLTEQDTRKQRRKNIFSGMFTDSCESNFDCDRPQVCCDLIFKKMCCASGVGIYNPSIATQRVAIPIPVSDDLPTNY